MSGFVKVYGSILDSSVWSESKEVRLLWVALLAMADPVGLVEASVPGLARRANLTVPECETALAVLLAPDAYSKSPAHDGRRIEKVQRGWLILNYLEYRERRDDRRYDTGDASYVYYARAEGQVKIGSSKNPWARVSELATARPGIALIAVERGGARVEQQRHEQFAHLRIEREWFTWCAEIESFIEPFRSSRSDERRDDSASASPSVSQSVPEKQKAVQKEMPVRREGATDATGLLDIGDGKGGQRLVHFGPCHDIVVGCVRAMRVPAAFLASLRMHLDGELQHEVATADQLGLAVQQWAGMNEQRFDGRFFAGIVRGVKRRMEVSGNRARNVAETKFMENEEQQQKVREREEREGKLLAYGRREQPDRMRQLETIADGQVPKKYQDDTRAYMVHGVLVDLCRKEWPDAR